MWGLKGFPYDRGQNEPAALHPEVLGSQADRQDERFRRWLGRVVTYPVV